jgi:hypothetical protein
MKIGGGIAEVVLFRERVGLRCRKQPWHSLLLCYRLKFALDELSSAMNTRCTQSMTRRRI